MMLMFFIYGKYSDLFSVLSLKYLLTDNKKNKAISIKFLQKYKKTSVSETNIFGNYKNGC